MDFNSIIDRALGENQGSALFTKKSNGKYSFFLPVTNLGELGSSPEQIDKTVIGNKKATSIKGRQSTPQQTITYYNHRDNADIINANMDTPLEFMRLLPDLSAYTYSGEIDSKLNDTALNSAEQAELTITISSDVNYVRNAYALIEDTVMFENDIPSTIAIEGTASKTISTVTIPSDASISVISDTPSVATATYSDGKVTITGVVEGSAIVTITATKTGYNSFNRTILVLVK